MLKNNRKVIYKNKFNFNVKTVSMLFNKKQYRFYPATGLYIKAIRADLSGIGTLQVSTCQKRLWCTYKKYQIYYN